MINARTLVFRCCLLAALVSTGCANGPQTFATPEEAATALVNAFQPYDRDRLIAVLGTEGEDVIASGDPVADQEDFDRFVKSYRERHRFELGPDGTTTLVVGADEWPMPIPLVKSDSGYRFDSARGREEILNRRIGRNELDTIETCRAIADAQQEYFGSAVGGGAYAAKFISDAGKKNGLYWPTEPGQPESPLGPLVAEANTEGYTTPDGKSGPAPFHGYYYRMLTAQGANAPGGARSYMKDGRLADGFAVIAYPVEYDNSGIMTFIVSHNGIVYQRDLGEDTARKAEAITAFDPGPEWAVVP